MPEDHDQRFKTLLEVFFSDFLWLVAPTHAARLKLERAEFLRQDQFTDVLQGERRGVDIVSKVPSDLSEEIVLVHIEVEGVFRSEFNNRMRRYYMQLSLRYDLPILPIVLFLRGGPPDITKAERRALFLDEEIERFCYYSIGLSGADAEKYLAKQEPLAYALAALMRFTSGSGAQHKLACLQRLTRARLDPARQFLLLDCVETYLSLEGQELLEYTHLIEAEPEQETKTMELWWSQKIEERARTQALAEGKAEGKAEAIIKIARKRGLAISEEQQSKVFACVENELLDRWLDRALTVDSAEQIFLES